MSLSLSLLEGLLGRTPAPGEVVTVPVERVMAHDGTGPVLARALERYGIEDLAAADRCVFVFDHYYPPVSPREAELQAFARAFAARHGIPVHAGQGIAHQLLMERGWVAPGTVLVGADSHTCSGGAAGAFATGLGATDVAAVLAAGTLWLEVPEPLRISLVGELPSATDPHDLVLEVVRRVGTRGALGRVIEFVGPAVASLDMAARFKLANHAVEMGAVAGLFGIDARSRAWLSARGVDLSRAERVPHDPRGRDAELVVDLAEVRPVAALPSSPDRVQPIDSGGAATPVDQVFIGSCAGGRLEDLRAAARVLAGRRVHPGVRLLVGPASAEVLRDALAEGTLGTLLEAGATLLPPGCGACLGRLGTLAPDEVAVATQNRNFVGRAGSPRSRLYLASPVSAAQAALRGELRVRAP